MLQMKGDILQFQKLYAKDVQNGHSISMYNRVPMSQFFSISFQVWRMLG
jgi:hypothetical protein